ncbi:MAG: exosortase-associated EpsI family protein [Pirellulaceae bacterium]|jgi:hypothetical protein|nr:exosortase-associated EpsI family protein [Pirellulaceae bacterium]MDP7019252.1 exosortase-associated EpsI family protein [Pirellulaceae bacterium]
MTDTPVANIAWPSKTGVVTLLFCAGHSFDLLDTWHTSPLDRFAWVALVVWLSPLPFFRLFDRKRELLGCESMVLYAAAVTASLIGQLGCVNAFEHFGLILAVTGLLRWTWRSLIWISAGVSWMPAFGWLASSVAPDQVLTMRVALASVGVAMVISPFTRTSSNAIHTSELKSFVLTGGIVAAVLIGCLWQFAPMGSGESRLLRLPTDGPSFRSWTVPLKEEEEQLLGGSLASRRMYDFSGRRAIVSVVDGGMNRHAVHDPLYCFRGAGYEIRSVRQFPVDGGYAKHVTIARDRKSTDIVYWFSNGQRRHASVINYWWQSTLRRLSLGRSGAEPLLVILQFESPVHDVDSVQQQCEPLFSL